jgi:hypothetical protein
MATTFHMCHCGTAGWSCDWIRVGQFDTAIELGSRYNSRAADIQ